MDADKAPTISINNENPDTPSLEPAPQTNEDEPAVACSDQNAAEAVPVKTLASGDGSDSGVEIGAATNNNVVLQRALSSNSGGYASSCGLEDNIGAVSCNSSMISYCSDTCEKTSSTVVLPIDFYASEGGSESSSVTGDPAVRRLASSAKKKVAVKESGLSKSPRRSNDSNSSGKSSTRSRPPSAVSRSQSLSIKSSAPNLATRERARSRDKTKPELAPPIFVTPQKNLMTTSLTRSMSLKRPPKPDSLSLSPRVNLSRTPSLTRGKTPLATPTNGGDDGRWPSVGNRTALQTPRVSKNLMAASSSSAASTPTNHTDTLVIRTRIGNIQLESKSSALDKYATLPRRRKERSSENLAGSRSNSVTRNGDAAGRMTSSVAAVMAAKKLIGSNGGSRTMPAYPKIAKKPVVPKTKIYHETAVQTAITSKDVDEAFAGTSKNVPRIDAVEMKTKETQSDIRDREMEKLREQIARMSADHSQLLSRLSEKSQAMSELQQELLKEKEEKLIAQKELQNNTERVMHMLENFQAGPGAVEKEGDSLLMLESQLLISGSVLEKQQEEIVKLQNICRALQRDMERSLKVQDNLIRQKNELEEESTELQDFLQAEKFAFMDALKEAENENRSVKEKLMQRESELERQQEECRHLVRICEQRRQEYLGMHAKYSALEGRSKDLLLSQGSAVSGANVALASLQGRIEHLVEQLISSYNISEQDLEDLVFFNDAYANSSSSGDGSPDFDTAKTSTSEKSPQRNQSFLAAVINAIKNATISKPASSHPSKHANNNNNKNDPEDDDADDSTEMLDSETEPCLMMENVLEDVHMPDSHSHNLVSTSQLMLSQIEIPSEILKSSLHDCRDGSLDNLSQAIANRQQIELQTHAMHQSRRHNSERNSTSDDLSQESGADVPSIGDFYTAQSLVDQVIEVDNSITKLLKVLRLIQMDNDSCIQELVVDKNKIQVSKEEALEKLSDWEMINQKLKAELKDATQQLIVKSNELANSKTELQRHRQEIDRLNQDICNLSTLCTENNEKKIDKEEILAALQVWQESGNLPEDEIVSHVVAACNEIPILKEKLREKERQLTDAKNCSVMNSTLHQAVAEAKRQYDAIDNALETLHSIQNIVKDCPQLTKMQRELEETNFNTINSLPIEHLNMSNGNIVTADLNANESTLNDSGGAQIINSTA